MPVKTSGWALLAKIWNGYNNEVEVRRCLNNAMGLCASSGDWNTCINSFLEYLDDKVMAKFCLGENRSVAITSYDWIQIANHSHLLGEKEFHFCTALANAESRAFDYYDYTGLAQSYQNIFNDSARVAGFLKKAELFICDDSKWDYIAFLWEELVESERETTRCRGNLSKPRITSAASLSIESQEELKSAKIVRVKLAEEQADDVVSFCECAEDWINIHAHKSAHACLRKAEDCAGDFEGWLYISTHWKIFNQPNSVKKCLKNAEHIAASPEDYLEVADVWFKLLNDVLKVKKILDTVESFTSSNPWVYYELARITLSCSIENSGLKGYLERAEELIKLNRWRNSRLLFCLAELWSKLPESSHRVEHCLKQAEKNIQVGGRTLIELYKCAKLWKTLANNQEGANRCLEKAQPYIDFTRYGIRKYTGLCIQLTGDHLIPKKFLEACEKSNTTFEEWMVCSHGWLHIDTNIRQARISLIHAEKLARISEEWNTCAVQWKVLSEESRAEICFSNVSE